MKSCGHHYAGKSYCLSWCEECVAYAIAKLLRNGQATAKAAAVAWVRQEEHRDPERGARVAEKAKKYHSLEKKLA